MSRTTGHAGQNGQPRPNSMVLEARALPAFIVEGEQPLPAYAKRQLSKPGITGALLFFRPIIHLFARSLGWSIGRILRSLKKKKKKHPLGSLAFFCMMILGGWFVNSETDPQQPLVDKSPEIFQPTWVPLNKPIALYGLNTPELDKLDYSHEARRHISGKREDSMSYGRFSQFEPHVRLIIARDVSPKPQEEQTSNPLGLKTAKPRVPNSYIELTRSAAHAGHAVLRMAQTELMMTKFGAAETADALLTEGSVERSCLVFRILADTETLQISGWSCGTERHPSDRSQLACLIDRVDLVSAGEDVALKSLFAVAERKREPRCGPISRSAGKKTTWLDPSAAPPALRTLKTAQNSQNVR